MFLFFMKECFGLIRATYDPAVPLLQQKKDLAQQFNQKIEEMNPTKDMVHSVVNESHLLILWENADNISELGHSVDALLAHFAREISEYMSNASDGAPQLQLYIDSPQTLMGNDSEPLTIIRRLAIIYNKTKIVPIFLDNSLWKHIDSWRLYSEEGKIMESLKENASEEKQLKFFNETRVTMRSGMLRKKDADYTKRLCNMVNSLYILCGREFEFSVQEDSFIYQYFEWQAAEKPDINSCVEKTANIKKSTFYKYATIFEQNPFYAEYCKIYQFKLKGSFKKGASVDAVAFLNDYKVMEASAKDESELYDLLLTKYPDILSDIDIPRIKLSCEKKIAVMKKKKTYQKALEEHGLKSL